jgi:hypothetical protein
MEQALELGLADGAGERVVVDGVGEVDERPGGRGDGDPVPGRALVGTERGTMVGDPHHPPHRPRRHVDQAFAVDEAPQHRRAPVAEHRAVSAREHGGEPSRLATRRAVAYGVHARVQAVQPTAGDTPLDLVLRGTEGEQLRTGDNAVLAARHPRHQLVDVTIDRFGPHTGPRRSIAEFAPG